MIHRLLEKAGRGEIRADETSVASTWDEMLRVAEVEMSRSWLERHLVPLRCHVADFEVRRLRAWKLALSLARERGGLGSGTAREGGGFEYWVETPDGKVGGYIDRLIEGADGAVIRDYKTGAVLDAAREGEPVRIKAAYETQLQLYAALLAARDGRWPVRLEVVTLSGEIVGIPVDRAKCTELLEVALDSLDRVNEVIAQVASLPAERHPELKLASPKPDVCRNCPFRPSCYAYESTRTNASLGEWPWDVWGQVIRVNRRPKGSASVEISACSDGGGRAHVRDLSTSPDRHPALDRMAAGRWAGLYSLRPAGARDSYRESDLTAVYIRD